MKVLILSFTLFLIPFLGNSQNSKSYYRWVPTKESYCRANQLKFGGGVQAKVVNVDASFSWKKEKCTEQQTLNQQRVNINKGIHAAKGKEFYFDGNMFYEISNTTCSARGITVAQYLNLLE